MILEYKSFLYYSKEKSKNTPDSPFIKTIQYIRTHNLYLLF